MNTVLLMLLNTLSFLTTNVLEGVIGGASSIIPIGVITFTYYLIQAGIANFMKYSTGTTANIVMFTLFSGGFGAIGGIIGGTLADTYYNSIYSGIHYGASTTGVVALIGIVSTFIIHLSA